MEANMPSSVSLGAAESSPPNTSEARSTAHLGVAFCRLEQKKSNPPSLYAVFKAAFRREWRLSVQNKGDLLNPLVFFSLVAILFPLGIAPSADILAPVAPGILWVAALLAVLLSLDALFRPDLLDGSLEQLLLNGYSPTLQVMARLLVHWLLTGLPLVLLAPLLGVMLYLPGSAFWALMSSLLLGTLALSLIGAIGAAITTGLNKSGVLMTLLVLPLYIPVLIFGTGAIGGAVLGDPIGGHLALLAAVALLALAFAPLACTAGLKIAVAAD